MTELQGNGQSNGDLKRASWFQLDGKISLRDVVVIGGILMAGLKGYWDTQNALVRLEDTLVAVRSTQREVLSSLEKTREHNLDQDYRLRLLEDAMTRGR